mgnify:CR=1 FL=1
MNMLGGLDNPHIIHALAVHVPVAMALLGVLLALMCAVTQMKNAPLRRLAIGWYAIMAAISLLTILTGERTLGDIPGSVSAEIRNTVATHRMFGENIWIAALFTTLIAIFCGAKRDNIRNTFTVLMVMASLATMAWTSAAAWYGTTLIYRDGVGSPKPAAVAMESPGVPAAPEAMPGIPASTDLPVMPEVSPGEKAPATPIPPPPPLSATHEPYFGRLSKVWGDVFNFLWPTQ